MKTEQTPTLWSKENADLMRNVERFVYERFREVTDRDVDSLGDGAQAALDYILLNYNLANKNKNEPKPNEAMPEELWVFPHGETSKLLYNDGQTTRYSAHDVNTSPSLSVCYIRKDLYEDKDR